MMHLTLSKTQSQEELSQHPWISHMVLPVAPSSWETCYTLPQGNLAIQLESSGSSEKNIINHDDRTAGSYAPGLDLNLITFFV